MKISDALVSESTHPRYDAPLRIDESCLLIGDPPAQYKCHPWACANPARREIQAQHDLVSRASDRRRADA